MIKMQSLAGEAWFDAAGAAADLARHMGTAFFLDFETIGFVVPIWKGPAPINSSPSSSASTSFHRVEK